MIFVVGLNYCGYTNVEMFKMKFNFPTNVILNFLLIFN